MPEIALLNITPALSADLTKPREFESRYKVRLGENADLVADVVSQTEAHRRTTGSESRWGGYLAVDASAREVVGTCAYKGAPDEGGVIEIAYFTFPAFEDRGFATAMAGALEGKASETGSVRLIVAHTLPEENASTRVLRKLGYNYAGEVSDPEEGRVWRWERLVSPEVAA